MIANQWYRFRTLFVTLASETIEPTIFGEACEFGLLAKDGVYIPVAPREIRSGYMTTGSRADFLIRCNEEGVHELASVAEARNQQDRQGNFLNGSLKGALAYLNVLPGETTATEDIAIPPFRVATPCYLADLVDVEPDHYSYILQSGRVPDFPEMPARPKDVSFFAIAAGPNGTDMALDIQYSGPDPQQNFTFELKVSDVWEIDYYVPQTHPWHTHVFPFQVASLPMMDSHNDYFQVGDYHDVLMVPIGGDETQDFGKAILKMHLANHAGMMFAHCHDYTHMDKGMGIMANVMASQDGSTTSSKVSDCYLEVRGTFEYVGGGDGNVETQTPTEENTGSNASSAFLGLEKLLVALLAAVAFVL